MKKLLLGLGLGILYCTSMTSNVFAGSAVVDIGTGRPQPVTVATGGTLDIQYAGGLKGWCAAYEVFFSVDGKNPVSTGALGPGHPKTSSVIKLGPVASGNHAIRYTAKWVAAGSTCGSVNGPLGWGGNLTITTSDIRPAGFPCEVKVNGKVIKTVSAKDRQDCYNQTSFGSENCKTYASYFGPGNNLLEQYFNKTDRVNSDNCKGAVCPAVKTGCSGAQVGTLKSPGDQTCGSKWGEGTWAVCSNGKPATVVNATSAAECGKKIGAACGAFWFPRSGECDCYAGYSTTVPYGGKTYCVYNRSPIRTATQTGAIAYLAQEYRCAIAPATTAVWNGMAYAKACPAAGTSYTRAQALAAFSGIYIAKTANPGSMDEACEIKNGAGFKMSAMKTDKCTIVPVGKISFLNVIVTCAK